MANDKLFLNTIKYITESLYKYNDLTWAFTGGVNFQLHGMKVPINDIDIQTDKESAYKVEEIFNIYSTKPVCFLESEHIKSHFGKLCINGYKIEIMGDMQKRLSKDKWEPIKLSIIIVYSIYSLRNQLP